ncbi:MAG: vWA domain-containing protein, partial [bacterium]
MNYKLVIGMLITFCLALGLRAQDVVDVKVAPVALEKSKIDVVFVLDTTGSMGGLIAAAKTKIWTVVNALGQASPPPLIRIGLVGYRDKGDAYITKRVDISDNIDAVYA